MQKLPPHARELAYEAMKRIAPNELKLFDQLWEDFEENPELDLAGGSIREQRHGSGAQTGITLMGSVIIPLVVAVAGHAINKGVDEIIAWLKKKRGMDTAQAQQLAVVVIDLVDKAPPPK